METPVQTWSLNTNAEGMAKQQMTASQAGQYRVSYRVTDKGSGFGVQASESASPQSPIPNPSAASPHPNPLPKGEGTKPHTIEGGYVFTIIGEGFDGSQFRFNHVELVPDKREYAPGDTVKLQVNTDRADGTVLPCPAR